MKRSKSLRSAVLLSTALLCFVVTPPELSASEANPCQGAVDQLLKTYTNDAAFRALADRAFGNVKPLPGDYGPNPWIGKDVYDMAEFFARWCTFLPAVDGSHDNGLKYIREFAWFYYKNEYGVAFVQLVVATHHPSFDSLLLQRGCAGVDFVGLRRDVTAQPGN